jgi:hypothetical protein
MLPVIECTVFNPRKGKQIRQENIDSKLYPLSFKGFKHLHKAENEKLFKERKIKSGSSHLGVKPFFNSAILLISLLCSMIVVFGIHS